MKKIIIFIFLSLLIFKLEAKENLKFFLKKAIDNNLELNAERKNLETAFQEKNISRSEFLPTITLSGEQSSTTSLTELIKVEKVCRIAILTLKVGLFY